MHMAILAAFAAATFGQARQWHLGRAASPAATLP